MIDGEARKHIIAHLRALAGLIESGGWEVYRVEMGTETGDVSGPLATQKRLIVTGERLTLVVRDPQAVARVSSATAGRLMATALGRKGSDDA